ncbi:hypothetical protein HLK59_11435 [Streptomyces sp. S3(2020)]|uniref:hypothetical protein n=1 Tax=Streptomyces sp. S3(2020) TaxID=2732044 RepID=UPI0014890E36|nr:hypothetical protein [Streptomyces sp. S3(2020)]NNN30971.1 hypothetical protein [Streptomyces sp. S3(2020)]
MTGPRPAERGAGRPAPRRGDDGDTLGPVGHGDGARTEGVSAPRGVVEPEELHSRRVRVTGFSSYQATGSAYVLPTDGSDSDPFDIRTNPYDGPRSDPLAFFYHRRSRIAGTRGDSTPRVLDEAHWEHDAQQRAPHRPFAAAPSACVFGLYDTTYADHCPAAARRAWTTCSAVTGYGERRTPASSTTASGRAKRTSHRPTLRLVHSRAAPNDDLQEPVACAPSNGGQPAVSRLPRPVR